MCPASDYLTALIWGGVSAVLGGAGTAAGTPLRLLGRARTGGEL